MKIVRTAQEMRAFREEQGSGTNGFVPTMGALHEGHLSLIRRSIEENEQTIVSIYLNPTQFNDKKDLDSYPVTWESDKAALEQLGVDVLFAPDYTVMYPDDYRYKVSESGLSGILCGAARPGHFDGVLTIVMKLLNMAGPCRAYFGEKDYQQLQLIRGMAEAFFMPVSVVPCAIVREDDGLAMSSRNVKLSPAGRSTAPLLYKELSGGKPLDRIRSGLKKAGFRIDYLEEINGRRYAAVFLEGVRLIDNVRI